MGESPFVVAGVENTFFFMRESACLPGGCWSKVCVCVCTGAEPMPSRGSSSV